MDSGGFIVEWQWQITVVLALCLFLAASILWIWFCLKVQKRREFEQNRMYMVDGMDRVDTNSRDKTPGFAELGPERSYSICDLEYALIIQVLRRVVGSNWRSSLKTFKREKMTDDVLRSISCDPDNDSEEMWKALLPLMGIRVTFKKMWKEEREHHANRNSGALDPDDGRQVEMAPVETPPGIARPERTAEGNETKCEDASHPLPGTVLVYGD